MTDKKNQLRYVYICKTRKALTRVKMACINKNIEYTLVGKYNIILTNDIVPLRICNDVELGIICEIPIRKDILCGRK